MARAALLGLLVATGLAGLCGCGGGGATAFRSGPVAGQEVRSTRSLPVNGARELRIETPSGRIIAGPGRDGVVEVEQEAFARGPLEPQELQEWVSRIQVTETRRGEALILRAEWPSQSPVQMNLGVHFVVKVPPQFSLNLRTGLGAVEATQVTGSVEAHSDNGPITLRRIGAAVRARAGLGRIEAGEISGNARLEADNSDITARYITGDLHARSGFGSIQAGFIGGKVDLGSDNGSVSLSSARGNARAHSGHGEVMLSDVAGSVDARSDNGRVGVRRPRGAVRARSGFGDLEVAEAQAAGEQFYLDSDNGRVRFAGSAGNLTCRSGMGSVEAELATLPRSVDLRSDNGAVSVTLPERADADVTANTDNGIVDLSGLRAPPTTARGQEWHGRLGAGGSSLRLHTGMGDVTLRQR